MNEDSSSIRVNIKPRELPDDYVDACVYKALQKAIMRIYVREYKDEHCMAHMEELVESDLNALVGDELIVDFRVASTQDVITWEYLYPNIFQRMLKRALCFLRMCLPKYPLGSKVAIMKVFVRKDKTPQYTVYVCTCNTHTALDIEHLDSCVILNVN